MVVAPARAARITRCRSLRQDASSPVFAPSAPFSLFAVPEKRCDLFQRLEGGNPLGSPRIACFAAPPCQKLRLRSCPQPQCLGVCRRARTAGGPGGRCQRCALAHLQRLCAARPGSNRGQLGGTDVPAAHQPGPAVRRGRCPDTRRHRDPAYHAEDSQQSLLCRSFTCRSPRRAACPSQVGRRLSRAAPGRRPHQVLQRAGAQPGSHSVRL